MNRNQAKEILPIIQHLYNKWEDIEELTSDLIINPELYRIKPEPKYRPFKDEEECWEEMQKHQPFGWVKSKDEDEGIYYSIYVTISDTNLFENDFRKFTFADGTPFGIKEE